MWQSMFEALQYSASNMDCHICEPWKFSIELQTHLGVHYHEMLIASSCKFYLSLLSSLQDLLTRVEEAVDKFLYWDEEVTIIEAVTSVSVLIYNCDLQPIRCLEISHVTACDCTIAYWCEFTG